MRSRTFSCATDQRARAAEVLVSAGVILVPLDELVTHTLGWFDEYLGVPAGS
jgi:hypothetical protein